MNLKPLAPASPPMSNVSRILTPLAPASPPMSNVSRNLTPLAPASPPDEKCLKNPDAARSGFAARCEAGLCPAGSKFLYLSLGCALGSGSALGRLGAKGRCERRAIIASANDFCLTSRPSGGEAGVSGVRLLIGRRGRTDEVPFKERYVY